ncbi:Uma2 family endonuclease [Pannus brasiliensis CCIBt3594]|uniref:Uma2 family endonuclease n=1 Tax=Pannus brasiliensis CCIBt3594 TaxID=1427578 RepID=A0AAW9QXQ5_9CHRO
MTDATTLGDRILWEKLPDDFILPDDPVDNINQPALAAALTESLAIAGKLGEFSLTTTNYGICARIGTRFVVKAPDWSYIPRISVPREEVIRSYTPRLQGDIPLIVMEFLSETEGDEYSGKPTYPPGKWFFYEKILQVPNYVIFTPERGELECYSLDNTGEYELRSPDEWGRYFIEGLDLFLGVWSGTRENRSGYWLRWWTESGELLLWGGESIDRARQQIQAEQQRAEAERQRAERLETFLWEQGIDPDRI